MLEQHLALQPWLNVSGAVVARRPHRRQSVTCQAAAKVRFSIQKEVGFGEETRIVGNIPALGGWDVGKAPKMGWSDGHIWSVELELPSDQDIEFKCVKVAGGNTEWEAASNRSLQLPDSKDVLDVQVQWNSDSLDLGSGGPFGNGAVRRSLSYGNRIDYDNGSDEAWDGDRPSHLRWQGRETRFMTSNEHSRDREGKWDVRGLQGPAREIVSADEKAASWLGKMQIVKKILVDQAGRVADKEAVANAFIYLQWINSGAIDCKEGGGHFRPNKHAELSREIFKSMERTIEKGGDDQVLQLLARKVQTKLPSFTEAYTQSTPLTRIRDIAHRNDIPSDLKREIKHTIQNKLHRNAGPEDLVATEAMLERIQSEGHYNQDFVNEFRVFRDELREFFNASTFTSMLEGLRPSLEDADVEVLNKFLEAKHKADNADASIASLGPLVEALHTLTTLRACLLDRLSSGLRNDASDSALAMRQRFRLSEIRAEDLVFVLLSRIINVLSQNGGEHALVNAEDSQWDLPLGALILSVRHLGLSGWRQGECMAVENELGTWQQAGKLSQRDQALRLKATLDRMHRLTQEYTDALLATFTDRADKLGAGLGINPEIVQVFAEADIRASAVFQISKLCLLLIKSSRQNSGDVGWDVLVSGSASGRMVEVDAIDMKVLQGLRQPSILIVKSASGDEEIAGCGDNLRAVILKQSLPHLSHLGIRARQEGIVFVACEDEELLRTELSKLQGSPIQLSAFPTSVQLKDATEEDVVARSSQKRSSLDKTLLKIEKRIGLIRIDEATVETCGSKAAFCAELQELSESGLFSTPISFCLPFGNMENALKTTGKLKEAETLLKKLDDADASDDSLAELSSELSQLVETHAIWQNDEGYEYLVEESAMVIARSSANVEDLTGMSAAGLYDSIGGIHTENGTKMQQAVAKVWASLYTLRAVLARRAAGILQKDAGMAVLIQEQLQPDYSFVLHTQDPFEKEADNIYVELAPGLGETLASGIRGSPWRFTIAKHSGDVKLLAFANFSHALQAYEPSSRNLNPGNKLYEELTTDYSTDQMTLDPSNIAALAGRLKEIGLFLETELEGPQDIEGAVIGDEIFVVQSRPQL